MKWPVEKKIAGGFGLLLTILIIIGVISFQSTLKFIETSRLETKARIIVKKLENVLTEITNAETGQRGYIITGDERYLVPYHAAVANIDHEVKELSKLIRDNPDHQRNLDALKPLLAEKFKGLQERIDLRKNKGFEAAAQEVRSGKGRIAMDKIRKIITEMENGERELLKQKAAEAEASSKRTIFIIIFGSSLAFVIVGIASFLTRKELIARKQAEEAIKQSEERFRIVFDSANDGILVADLETKKILLANKTICHMLGYDKDEILNLEISELHQKEDLPYIMKALEESLAVEISYKENIPFKRKDRSVFYVDISHSMINIGGRSCMMGIFRDVTERKRAEETLQNAYAELEQKVEDRTTELRKINESLQKEITERKQTEKKLETASREWRITVDSTNDLIMLLDSGMKIIKANLATTRFLNRPFNEILGKNCFQLLCGADRPPAACPIEKMKMTKKHEEVELYLPERGIWIWISVNPIFDDKGNLIGSVYIIRDITVRKKADEALKRRLEFEKTIANISSRFIEVPDIDEAINAALRDMGILNGASRAYLFLFSEDETSMDNTHEWCKEGVTPQIDNLKNLPTEMFPWWMQKLHNREVIYITDVSKMPEKAKAEKKILEGQDIKSLLVIPLITTDKLAGFIGFDNVEETGEWSEEDLTLLRVSSELIGSALGRKRAEEALRESEEKFRTLVQTIPECVYSALPTGETLYMSPAVEDIFGYSAEEFHKDKDLWIRLLYKDDQKELLIKLEKLLEEGVPYIHEFRMRRKDENIVWIRDHANAIIDDKGKPIRITGIIYDITERKKAEEELRKYQEQLRSLASQLSITEERERHRIATDLHDHIGQTLALCKIKLGALRESAPPTLAVSVDGIRDLIEQTIQYTRSLTSELSPPILYELGFEAAVEWLGEQILSRQDIHFHFNDDGQPKPMEDEARVLLFQAVRELMVNVVKHSQARNSSVSIRRDGNNIQIKVEDDGVGFDISKLDSYLRTRGFGIFSIRERLNSIGGHLNVESGPGKGTRVTIVAPLK